MTSEQAQTERRPGYYPVHPHWTAVPEWVTEYQLDRLLDLRMIRVRSVGEPAVFQWRMTKRSELSGMSAATIEQNLRTDLAARDATIAELRAEIARMTLAANAWHQT